MLHNGPAPDERSTGDKALWHRTGWAVAGEQIHGAKIDIGADGHDGSEEQGR